MNSKKVFDIYSGLWFVKARPECQFCMKCEYCNNEFQNYMSKLRFLIEKYNLKYYYKYETEGLQLLNSEQDLVEDFKYVALAATKGPNDKPNEMPKNGSIFENLFNEIYN